MALAKTPRRPKGNLTAAAIVVLFAAGVLAGLWYYIQTHAPDCFADETKAFTECANLALSQGWMAWTWQTAAFFVIIFLLLCTMSVWELLSPGGAPRAGIFGIDTTRGDRLFITLIGSAYFVVAWLLLGEYLIVGVLVMWAAFVFWKV